MHFLEDSFLSFCARFILPFENVVYHRLDQQIGILLEMPLFLREDFTERIYVQNENKNKALRTKKRENKANPTGYW